MVYIYGIYTVYIPYIYSIYTVYIWYIYYIYTGIYTGIPYNDLYIDVYLYYTLRVIIQLNMGPRILANSERQVYIPIGI